MKIENSSLKLGYFPIFPEINYYDKNKPLLKINNIESALVAEDYSILIDDQGNGFSFGNNEKGQLIQGHNHYTEEINLIKYIQNNIKEIKSNGEANILLTKDEKVIKFSYFRQNSTNKPLVYKIDSKIHIINLSCGKNFTILLSKQGILFSFGNKNIHGELGHGDFKPRLNPELINKLIEYKEKIIQIECGYKHVLAMSSLGRVYSWGTVILPYYLLKFKKSFYLFKNDRIHMVNLE